MSVTEIIQEIDRLSTEERKEAIKGVLHVVYPQGGKVIDRLLKRLEHPDIPEGFWEGMEEIEDGKAIEMKDEHFDRPPL